MQMAWWLVATLSAGYSQGWSWAQDLYNPDKPHWGFKSMMPGSIMKINVSPHNL